MIVEEIPAALAGERLDRVVSLLADVTRSEASALVAGGFVLVDGTVSTVGKLRLRTGQQIEIDRDRLPERPSPAPEAGVPCDVVFADDEVIVIDKPAGLVVHPGAGNSSGTLVNALLARFPEIAVVGDPQRPGIVHRLDVGTSGLLVVARSHHAYGVLVEALARRAVTREYLALVWGRPEVNQGVVDAPVGRDPRDPLRMAVVATGREARTRFEVVQRFADPSVTLVRCSLETGRTHQIRVHLAGIGHPVVGDATYGGVRDRIALHRPFLHAARLVFTHPTRGADQSFESALPDDLQVVLATLHPESDD